MIDYIKKILLTASVLLTVCFVGTSECFSQSTIKGEWRNVKIGGGGFVSSIINSTAEPGLFYARTDVGGAYRWDNLTSEWIPLLDWVTADQRAFLGVESIALDPKDASKLYMTVGLSGYGWPGSSLLISDDYGASFETIPLDLYVHGNGMGRQTGEKLIVDPNASNILYLGTRQAGLMKSEDYGKTWSSVDAFPDANTPNLNGISFVALDPNSGSSDKGSQKMVVGLSKENENLFISNDGGASFDLIEGAPTELGIMPHRASWNEDATAIFFTFANGAGPHSQNWDGVNELMNRGAVFKFDLQDKTWTNISPLNLWQNAELSGCYGGMAFGHGKLYVSTINHWSQQQFYEDGRSAWGDRIYVSSDDGVTWRALFNDMKLNTGGVSWISGHNLHWVGSLTLDIEDENILWATSGNGVFRSNDITEDSPDMVFKVEGLEETVPLDMVSIPNRSFVSIVGDYDGWVHHDVDQYPKGRRHEPNMGTSTGISFSENKPDVLVRAGSSSSVLYYSINGGDAWTAFDHLPVGANNGKVAVSTSENEVFVAWIPSEHNDKFYITSNFGETWTNVWNPSYGSLQNAHPYEDPEKPGVFYVYIPSNGKLQKIIYSAQGRPEVEEIAQLTNGGSNQISVDPYESDRIIVALGLNGLAIVKDGQISNVTNIEADAVSIGKPHSTMTNSTLFVWGTHRGTTGVFRSTNNGETWFRINDNAHMYGGLGNAQMILGDRDVFGRVYISTAGRGIAVGDSQFDTLYLDPLDQTTSAINWDKELKEINPFYPNPSSDIVYCDQEMDHANTFISNSMGQLIKPNWIGANAIDIRLLPKGIYWVFTNEKVVRKYLGNFVKK